MKTNLSAKSNAVLTCEETKEGKIIAIISCGKQEDITKKVEKAIKEHYVAKIVTLIESEKEVLTNQTYTYFSAFITEIGMLPIVKEFCLEIVATY